MSLPSIESQFTVPEEKVPQEGVEGLPNQPREVLESSLPKESISDSELADAIFGRYKSASDEASRRVWLEALALVTGEPSTDQHQPE